MFVLKATFLKHRRKNFLKLKMTYNLTGKGKSDLETGLLEDRDEFNIYLRIFINYCKIFVKASLGKVKIGEEISFKRSIYQ